MARIYAFLLVTFALIFGVSLAFRSHYVNKYKNRYFICAVLINAVLLLSEVGKFVGMYCQIRWLIISMNSVNYALAPMLPYCIVLMNRKCWKLGEKLAMIPALLVMLVAFTSPWTGLLFYVDEMNNYTRGPLYTVSLIISIIYFLMLTVTSFFEYRDADFTEKVYLLAILGLAMGGVLLQVVLPDTSSMWTTTGISLILYYTFGLELSNKYDVLTGVRNRRAFDSHKATLFPARNYSLIVFDINGLKPVNDNMGHKEGDKLIMGVANLLANSFYGIGKIYRIGGDEFCIICDEKDEKRVSLALAEMEESIARANKNNRNKFTISVSYGMEIHKADDNRDSQEVFNTADGRMYEMKQDYYRKKNIPARGEQ